MKTSTSTSKLAIKKFNVIKLEDQKLNTSNHSFSIETWML